MDSKDQPQPQSPFMPMFEHFRAELDEHHDRRERIIKASRDITAASKKIIFTLQRIRKINQATPEHIQKSNKQYYSTIRTQLSSVSKDLQGLNAQRYARQISGGCQEYIEAASFEHYLTHAKILTFDEAVANVRDLSSPMNAEGGENIKTEDGETPSISLTPEDYVLGIYDQTGEVMRFAITAMATNGALPSIAASADSDTMDTGPEKAERNVLTDLRALRSALEGLNAHGGPFGRECDKKAEVMRTSVEKVERALYGLTVRGAERPKGWMPDVSEGGRTVEVEG